MNAKKAKAIRRIYGDNKKAARKARRVISTSGALASQNPKQLGAGPAVPVGRPGYSTPDRMAPHASPLRAIFAIADGSSKVARSLIGNALYPMDCGRDPIKFIAHGPRTRANAVLRRLQA